MTSSKLHESRGSSESPPFWDLLRRSGCIFEVDLKGTSMEPAIPHGARVRIRAVPAESYRTGQVVACVTSGELFAHRIVFCGEHGRDQPFVITLGDNLLLCDPPTRKADILGLVAEYSAGATWHSPGEAQQRGRAQAAVVGAHRTLLRICLVIHYELARRVGGIVLIAATLFKRAHSVVVRPRT